MQRAAAVLFVSAACWTRASTSIAARRRANPLGEVVELLDQLTAKIQEEAASEAKSFKEFAQWCADAARNKDHEVTTGTARKLQLEASIGKSAGEAESATVRIEELAASLAADDSDLKSAAVIREKEYADFSAGEKELTESIDTLSRAIAVVQREMQKNPGAFAQIESTNMKSFVQAMSTLVDAASFSSADKQRLYALVQSQQSQASDADGDSFSFGPPAPSAYKSHSGSIVDVLEDLKEKAIEQLAELRKAETNSKHNYDMLRQSLEDQIAADNKDLSDEKASKASHEEAKAAAEGDLASTLKSLADSADTLQTVRGDCMTTAADHEATVASRQEELKALGQAKEILANSTSGAAQQAYSFLQFRGTTVGERISGLAAGTTEVRSSLRTGADLAKAEVVTLVRQLARDHHSAALAQLAARIDAVIKMGARNNEDPFAKVRALIQDLISRLEAESSNEATEKAYCDEQLSQTEEKRTDLSNEVAKLDSKIEKAASTSAGLKEDIQQYLAELAALAGSQAEADKMRHDSHDAYLQAKADLEQGLNGVRRAVGLLREYYANDGSEAGGASAMLQTHLHLGASARQPAPPQKHEKSAGHGAYLQAKGDLEQGLNGVRRAGGLLRANDGGAAGGASAMVQTHLGASARQPAPPQKHEKSAGAGSSIIGILEVVESDFAKNLAMAETEEADEQSEYDKSTQENKVTRALREQDVKYAEREAQRLDADVSSLSSDRETTGAELDAVEEYDTKIKSRCIAKPESYEERGKRREAEIAGLKEALNILEQETAFVQRRQHGYRRGSLAFLGIKR